MSPSIKKVLNALILNTDENSKKERDLIKEANRNYRRNQKRIKKIRQEQQRKNG